MNATTKTNAKTSILTSDEGLTIRETNTLTDAIDILFAHPAVAAELIAVLNGDISALTARLNVADLAAQDVATLLERMEDTFTAAQRAARDAGTGSLATYKGMTALLDMLRAEGRLR